MRGGSWPTLQLGETTTKDWQNCPSPKRWEGRKFQTWLICSGKNCKHSVFVILKRENFLIKKHHVWCIGLFIYITFEGLIYGCMLKQARWKQRGIFGFQGWLLERMRLIPWSYARKGNKQDGRLSVGFIVFKHRRVILRRSNVYAYLSTFSQQSLEYTEMFGVSPTDHANNGIWICSIKTCPDLPVRLWS